MKIIYISNIYYIEYQDVPASRILGELLDLNQSKKEENIYDDFKCINDKQIIDIENKILSFSKDKTYNYASPIVNKENNLPKININLISLKKYFINEELNEESKMDLQNEINIINDYFSVLTSNINFQKAETIREQSIIYYLYYFMSSTLLYLLFNPNFCVDKTTSENCLTFLDNYYNIKEAAELYINKNKLKESNFLIVNNNQQIDEYYELTDYKDEFREMVERCNELLSIILYSIGYPNTEEKVEGSKIDEKMIFLLEKFTQVFNIFHSVNEKFNIIDYKCFYNESLSKHLNLEREFQIFINNERIMKERENINEENRNSEINGDDKIEFTLLSHTWLFDPSAKYEIINLFNENKQIQQVSNNNLNDLNEINQLFYLGTLLNNDDIFFRLKIRRNNIIEDTLNEISNFPDRLQFPLKVEFVGEEAEDEGGVRKEYFILVIRKIFDVNYGMFTYNEKTRLFWFNLNSFESKFKYELIGTILGLSLFNGVILDVKFPMAIYKKLLGIQPVLNDMKECDPEMYKSLSFLVNTKDENLKDSLDSNFTVTLDVFGEKKIIPLKPNGENIMIDFNNKDEFVELYLNWFFNESIKEFYEHFEIGFYKIFDKKLSKILSPQELELIICGTQDLDFTELKKAAKYEGYDSESATIKYLWEILMELNEEEKKKFLFFVTGCDRAPIDGLGTLPFTISRNANFDDLPSSHTCFNNLILPDYQNKEYMKNKLMIALNYSEGFGLK